MGGFKTAAAMLFPGWEPKRSCRAPHRDDKSPSFSVYQNQAGEWRFKDHTGEQGGVVGFVMLSGMDEKQAARWLMEKAGIVPGESADFMPRPKPERKPRAVEKLPPMPVEVIAKWNEGVNHLQSKSELIAGLASFRGWPAKFAQHLVDCAIVSMPLYHGQRGIAFLVETPENIGGELTMRDIGFHCRLKPKELGGRPSWRFVPNASEHRQSTPALPFIIGGSWFDSARLLVITEGQFDALTFALAAGWLGEGCKWPEGVCVIGIRGASGINAFLQPYAQFWPANANCLLLPDGDKPGEQWFEGPNSFADRLAKLCRKVAVVKCRAQKDFNDLYRAEKTTPEQIAELLASHGLALESGVA